MLNKSRSVYLIMIMIVAITIALLFNYKLLIVFISNKDIQLMIPEATQEYFHVIGGYTWDELLSKPSRGLDYLSYRIIFVSIGKFFRFSITQLAVLERLVISVLSFLGAYILTNSYLMKTNTNKCNEIKRTVAAFLGAMLYSTNPSFMIGDSFWLNIEFAYATLPWILWCFDRAITGKEIRYIILTSFLMAINIDEHFIWTGFPLVIVLYSIFISTLNSLSTKKVEVKPTLFAILVLILFIGLKIQLLIMKRLIVSPYAYSFTKTGLDVCWSSASLLNMLRAMSHMGLGTLYSPHHVIFNVLNALMPLTLVIPVIASLSLLLYRKNNIVLFYGVLLTLFILPFYKNSTFKFIHYWIFFHTPVGPAFRTWRIPDAFIALSLSVLISFSLYRIFNYLSRSKIFLIKKIVIILTIFIIILSYIVYSWPLLTGDVNGQLSLIETPSNYLELSSFLSSRDKYFRIVYIPEFLYSYGRNANFKPLWSPKVGAVQEFLTFLTSKPVLLPHKHWGHFYKFTVSPFYYSLLRIGNIKILSRFLSWVNVKYIVLHNDIPVLKDRVGRIIQLINESKSFKLVFNKDFIYVFENSLSKGSIYIPYELILVSGGYRAVKRFYEVFNASDVYGFLFVDQKVPLYLLKEVKGVLTDKPFDQLIYDIVFLEITNRKLGYVTYPYEYILEYNPRLRWSRASYLDPHQQEWHPFVNWKDYSWDFDYMRGIVFTINSKDSFEVPISLQKESEYVILVRYFANERGGAISLHLCNRNITINTLNDYNGFLWYVTTLNLSKECKKVIIKNIKGFNALSVIAFIPKRQFIELVNEAKNIISSKILITFDTNIISNPSFEYSLNGWKVDDRVLRDNKYNVIIDCSTAFSGNCSLRVSTSSNERPKYGWSWIRSEWVNVTPGEKYILITHMKAKNVNASHVVIEAYNESRNKVFQLAQVPSAKYGNFDWRTYTYEFVVPEGVSKIRVVLNAGWVLDKNQGEAITWFDDIKLIPLKTKHLKESVNSLLKIIDSPPALVKGYTEVNPTLWKVKVISRKPFMLVFAEAYNPLWEARVYKDGKLVERVRSIPVYGVINGFWIDETGNLTIVIRYVPQDWFELGLKISATTFALCVFYLVWDWRRCRGDRWALWLERRVRSIPRELRGVVMRFLS